MPTAPLPAQPRRQVAQRHLDVGAQARHRAVAGHAGHVEQLLRGHRHVLAQPVELVGPIAQDGVERLPADGHQVGVRHPGPVEAVAGLPGLVLA